MVSSNIMVAVLYFLNMRPPKGGRMTYCTCIFKVTLNSQSQWNYWRAQFAVQSLRNGCLRHGVTRDSWCMQVLAGHITNTVHNYYGEWEEMKLTLWLTFLRHLISGEHTTYCRQPLWSRRCPSGFETTLVCPTHEPVITGRVDLASIQKGLTLLLS